MRTLGAPLTAAQQAAATEPYVAVSVENLIGSLRRLEFATLDATANGITNHGVAVADDGSVTRIRVTAAGTLYRQRVANPAAGPWTSWTTQHTGKGDDCAVAARGTRVVIVYTDAAGTGIKYIESTDSGATYGGETAVTTAANPVKGLAVALKNSGGDLAVAWTTTTTLSIIKRTAGSFGAASGSGISVSSLNDLAMCYGADWDMAVAGVEVTTLRTSLWSIAYGDGGELAANTWGALNAQQQAETNSSVAFSAPSIAYAGGYRVTYVEADTFTGGVTRTYRTALHPLTTYVYGAFAWSAPAPVNYAGAGGLALGVMAGGSGYLYETAPDIVTRANLAQSLVMLTADVLAAAIDERGDATRGWLELDNAGGAYAGPPAPVQLGNLVNLSWGYRTSSGLVASRMADLFIAGMEYRRAGGVSVLRLQLEGGWELLRRNRQRTQIAHTGGETYFKILDRIFSRAGLQLQQGAVSSRSTSVTPKFMVHPATSGYDAARQVLSFLADRVKLVQFGAVMTEPLASAATTYTYGVIHPIRRLELLQVAPPVSDAQAYGAAAFGEAIDYASVSVGLGAKEQSRDLNSASGATAAATATAQLRQRAMDADAGVLIVPPNCGQEVLDLVDFSDPLVSASAVKRRVAGIDWRYERRRGVYEQTLHLGAA
jgi:hypothetical protein